MMPPLVAERFEIRRRLGAGSFGVVYEAVDRYRNRDVALKVLERVSPEVLSNFKREFRYLAELRHPNLASLYELISTHGSWLLSMELVGGIQLLEHLAFVELQNSFLMARSESVFDGDERIVFRRPARRDSLSPYYIEQVRDTFRQLATALGVLHAHGVIHRDLKPSNIMITREGRVALLDFGLVAPVSLEDSTARKLIAGTPGYMSPEQITGGTVTTASDWYAFGALLYQALTGHQPYDAFTFADLIEKQTTVDAVPASQVVPGIPDDLATLADDLLRRDPAARPSGTEVMKLFGVEDADTAHPARSENRNVEVIGRGRELNVLRGYVDDLRPGAPEIVMLHGSPGSGKSALASHLLDSLRASSDAFIVSGRCHQWESVPFNAVDALVDSLARSLRHGGNRTARDVLGRSVAVTQLFPALSGIGFSRVLDETIAVPPTGPKLVARAATELRSVLVAAAEERPLVLLLDNAQWGDYQSSLILRGVMQPDRGRIVLILIYRTEDRQTSLLLQGLRGFPVRTRELQLKDFSRNMTSRFLRMRLGHAGRRLTDRVFRAAKGNIILTSMIADALAAGESESTWLLTRAVARRLDPLSITAQRLFALLATAEGPVSEEEAERQLELFESDEALRALSRERLIRTRRTGDLREIDLYHERIREAVRGR